MYVPVSPLLLVVSAGPSACITSFSERKPFGPGSLLLLCRSPSALALQRAPCIGSTLVIGVPGYTPIAGQVVCCPAPTRPTQCVSACMSRQVDSGNKATCCRGRALAASTSMMLLWVDVWDFTFGPSNVVFDLFVGSASRCSSCFRTSHNCAASMVSAAVRGCLSGLVLSSWHCDGCRVLALYTVFWVLYSVRSGLGVRPRGASPTLCSVAWSL